MIVLCTGVAHRIHRAARDHEVFLRDTSTESFPNYSSSNFKLIEKIELISMYISSLIKNLLFRRIADSFAHSEMYLLVFFSAKEKWKENSARIFADT